MKIKRKIKKNKRKIKKKNENKTRILSWIYENNYFM